MYYYVITLLLTRRADDVVIYRGGTTHHYKRWGSPYLPVPLASRATADRWVVTYSHSGGPRRGSEGATIGHDVLPHPKNAGANCILYRPAIMIWGNFPRAVKPI